MLKSCKNMCSYFTHTNAHTLAQKQNIHLISCPHVTTAVLRKMSKIISWLYYQNKIGGKIISTIWAHKPFAEQEPRDIRMIMMIMIMVMMIMIMMTIKIIIIIIKRSLRSPATRRFIQYIVQANDKENIKILHLWTFVRPPVTGDPTQSARNTDAVYLSWRHHTGGGTYTTCPASRAPNRNKKCQQLLFWHRSIIPRY